MGPAPAMQTMPLILRQTLRSSIQLSRATTRPAHPQLGRTPVPVQPTPRSFSVCFRCQFRLQPRLHDPADDKGKAKYPLGSGSELNNASVPGTFPPELAPTAERLEKQSEEAENERIERELVENLEADLERRKESAQKASPEAIADLENTVNDLKSRAKLREESNVGGDPDKTQSGGLPSFVEQRRSKVSKQFTSMMDNLQSNVFVAGQRLNDLTGYSSIETLKKDIQEQGTALSKLLPSQTLKWLY